VGQPSKHIAVIGCGHWGKNLVRNFAELGALAAVADANAASAQAQASQHHVAVKTVDEILTDTTITGVVIAAPAAQHAALATQALTAGKHVFVEKPLALTVAEAEQLATLAATKKKTLMVGHLLHYHPVFLKLQKMVQAGEFGALRYVYSNRLNLGKFRTEEDVLWSFAPHDISMILGLTGAAPSEVFAHGAANLTNQIADTVNLQMQFESGVRAHVLVSWLHPTKEQKLVVIGEKLMAVFDDGQPWEQKLALYRHDVEWTDNVPTPVKADVEYTAVAQSEPLKNECQHFLDAITGKPVRTDAAEGIRVLQVLQAAKTSMKTGVPVKTATHIDGVFVHSTALVDAGATIGKGSKIWHFSHILPNTTIGENCVISQNVMAGPDVTIGNHCKIQNNVSLYKGVVLEDGVFCGPSCVFTNVNTPRAEVERKSEYLPTKVGRAATIGANATIICGNSLGAYCLIGAGAVVTKDVKAHALMVGNPAKQIGWVSHAGERLAEDLTCPRDGRKYQVVNDELVELENKNARVA
jgi:predicted dehydrogenase/acetyltransferase-like isoleucine patch superfamily enzyme